MASHTAEASRPSRPELPTRVAWSLAVVSTVWAGALLLMEWPSRWWLCLAFAAWFGAATWAQTRWPWPGVLLTGAGILALDRLGLPPENAAPLGPLMLALVVIGYLVAPRWSVWAVPVLLACTAITAGWDAPSATFGALLLLAFWSFGTLVRGRDARRRRAQADAARVALLDPAIRARRAAIAEREGVATAALTVIGESVQRMTRTAAAARESLDPAALDGIHHTGGEAVEQLRALLVPLRPDPLDAAPPAAPAPAGPGRPGWLALLLGSWPAVLMLLDALVIPLLAATTPDVPALLPMSTLVLVLLPMLVAVVLRSRFPSGALWVSTAVLGVGVLTGLADPSENGLSLSIAAAALSWAAGRAGNRRATLAWAAFTVVMLAAVAASAPENLPIQVTLTVLPFGAAAAWAGHHAAAAAHEQAVQARLAEIEAAERAAVAEERLGLARDLHDAASHAVGTMMMQANAARVLREREPDAAREALATIVATGREAVSELRAITMPAHDPIETAVPTPAPADADLESSLAPLVDAARRSGAEVRTTLDLRAAVGPPDLQLVVRIAREGLANAVRHAPGCAVEVTIRTTGERAEITVANGPARRLRAEDAPSAAGGIGLGQRGLRELLGERGGELSAGPDGEGYRLRAGFPLRIAAPVVAR